MKSIRDLSAAYVNQTIRVIDESVEVSGELETVNYVWGEGESVWGTGGAQELKGVLLKIGTWKGEVSTLGGFEVLDAQGLQKRLNDEIPGDRVKNPFNSPES